MSNSQCHDFHTSSNQNQIIIKENPIIIFMEISWYPSSNHTKSLYLMMLTPEKAPSCCSRHPPDARHHDLKKTFRKHNATKTGLMLILKEMSWVILKEMSWDFVSWDGRSVGSNWCLNGVLMGLQSKQNWGRHHLDSPCHLDLLKMAPNWTSSYN